MLRIKEYVKVKSAEEAYELLQKNRRSRIIGGMLWLRLQDVLIPTAIDMSDCGLDQIESENDEIKIGAMVTLRELETNPLITSLYDGIISDSVRDIVGVQFRNLATIGGSIFSRFGFSDILTALLCLPVDVILHHAGRMSLADFVKMPFERDVLTHIVVKKETGKACYLSERRSATDFPVLATAISYIDGHWNIAIGARPHRAQLLSVDLPLDFCDKDVEDVQNQVLSAMAFGSNMRGSKEYRMLLAKTLVARGMKAIREGSEC